MKRFSGNGLVASLCCPALSLLWGLMRFIYDLSWGADFGGRGIFRISYFFAILIGGFLSAILTLTFDIHTEYYLNKRLLIIIAVYVFHGIVGRFSFESNIVMLVLYMMVSVVAFVVQFCKVRDVNTDVGEGAILIISDPILYWTIYWFLLYSIN